MVVPFSDLLRRHTDASTAGVERAIFVSSDPDQMADLVGQVVSDLLGAPVGGGTFYRASSGCVFGLQLADARSVVLKAYQPQWELPFLQATHRAQQARSPERLPLPRTHRRAGPVRPRAGHAGVVSAGSGPPQAGWR
jgi:hypothetical protein